MKSPYWRLPSYLPSPLVSRVLIRPWVSKEGPDYGAFFAGNLVGGNNDPWFGVARPPGSAPSGAWEEEAAIRGEGVLARGGRAPGGTGDKKVLPGGAPGSVSVQPSLPISRGDQNLGAKRKGKGEANRVPR